MKHIYNQFDYWSHGECEIHKHKSIETYTSCGNFGTNILTIASTFFCYDILPFVDKMYSEIIWE
jgi:hypothetical protein